MNQKVVGLEIASKAGIIQGTCAEIFVALPSVPCEQVAIYNTSGVDLRVCYFDGVSAPRDGQTYLIVPAGTVQPLRGIHNANQIGVRRDDGTASAVVFPFYFEAV